METCVNILIWGIGIFIILAIIGYINERKSQQRIAAEIARKRALLKHVDSEDPQVISDYYSKIVNRDYSAFQDICNKNSELMGNFAKNCLELSSDCYMFIMLYEQLKHVPNTITRPDGEEFEFSDYKWDKELNACRETKAVLKATENLPVALFSDVFCFSSNEEKKKTIDALTKLASKDKLASGDIPAWPQKIFGQSVYYEIFKKDRLNTIKLNKVEVIEFVMNEADYYEHLTTFGNTIAQFYQTQYLLKEHFYHYIKLLDDIVKTNKDYKTFTQDQKNILATCILLFRCIENMCTMRLIDKDYDAPNNGFEKSSLSTCSGVDGYILNAIQMFGAADYQDAKGQAKAQIMSLEDLLEQKVQEVKELIEQCNDALIKLGEEELSFFPVHDMVLGGFINSNFDAQVCKEANSQYGRVKKILSQFTNDEGNGLSWYEEGHMPLLADIGFCSAHKVFFSDDGIVFGTNYKDISECQWPTKVIGSSAYNKLFHADNLDELDFEQEEYDEFLAHIGETITSLHRIQGIATSYCEALSEIYSLYTDLNAKTLAYVLDEDRANAQKVHHMHVCYEAFQKVYNFENGCFISKLPDDYAWGCQYVDVSRIKGLVKSKDEIINFINNPPAQFTPQIQPPVQQKAQAQQRASLNKRSQSSNTSDDEEALNQLLGQDPQLQAAAVLMTLNDSIKDPSILSDLDFDELKMYVKSIELMHETAVQQHDYDFLNNIDMFKDVLIAHAGRDLYQKAYNSFIKNKHFYDPYLRAVKFNINKPVHSKDELIDEMVMALAALQYTLVDEYIKACQMRLEALDSIYRNSSWNILEWELTRRLEQQMAMFD